MSKLDWFTILVIAVCVLAIGALIWNMKGLLGDGQQQTDVSENYEDGDLSEDADDTYDINIDGDEDGDDGAVTDSEGGVNSAENTGETINYDLEDSETPESTTVADRSSDTDVATEDGGAVSRRINTNTSPSNNRSDSDVDSGRFMVIVGSYKQMASAERMQRILKTKGYRDARIELFDNGTFARVLVGRSTSYAGAQDIQADLLADGFRDILIQEKKRK